MRTVRCVICAKNATSWCGHVHVQNGDKIMAGWCDEHGKEHNLAMSAQAFGMMGLEGTAKELFPGRFELRDRLFTEEVRRDCVGCLGDYVGEVRP